MLAQFSVILICHTLTIKIHSSNMILEKVNQTNSENIIRKLRKYKCKVKIYQRINARGVNRLFNPLMGLRLRLETYAPVCKKDSTLLYGWKQTLRHAVTI